MSIEIILNAVDTDRIIEMAWEDRTPFEAINCQFGISEQQVIQLMRKEMKLSSFRLWEKRVQGHSTKHSKPTEYLTYRFRCSRQRSISSIKISKKTGK